jgi:hypothetical protein
MQLVCPVASPEMVAELQTLVQRIRVGAHADEHQSHLIGDFHQFANKNGAR